MRFKNTLTNEWKYCSLNDLLVKKGYIRGPFGSALRVSEMKEEGVPVYEQQNAIYDNREFRYFIDDEKYQDLKRFTVKNNDLIISCSGTIGKISLIKENDPVGIINQALLILRLNLDLINPKFLKYFLETSKGFNSLTSSAGGSSQINLAKKDVIINMKIGIPDLKEQTRIITFISLLDNKINLLNKKLDNQVSFKKYLMQNIFSQKLRFDGFEDEWIQKNIDDLFEVITDYVAAGSFADIRKNVKYLEKGYAQLVRTVDLKKKFTTNEKVFVDKNAFEYLWRVNLDNESIVLPNIGANIGEVYFINPKQLPYENNVLAPNAILLKSNKGIKFKYYLLSQNYFNKQLNIINESSGQPKFNKTSLKKIKLLIPPSFEEQEKIANFLSAIDQKIELLNNQLSQMEEFKRGLLQSLFKYYLIKEVKLQVYFINFFRFYFVISAIKKEKINNH